jgi:hypothetical protein
MAETRSRPANGKYIESAQNVTAASGLPEGFRTISPVAEVRIVGDPKPKTSEKLDVASLYAHYSRETSRYETDVPIALIALRIGQAIERLRSALTEVDELQRENYISLGLAIFFETAVYVGFSSAFDEAFSLLSVSIVAHRTSPYSPSEVSALLKALEIMRQSPSPSDNDLDTIYNLLETAGFDVNAPLAGIELGDEGEMSE